MMKWGLIPHWFSEYGNENNMANKTLNARCETLQEKKSFQVVSRNRCLVLINGFYEWNSSFGKKYPYYIQNETSEFLTLGGVWDSWLDQVGNEVQTFSIITTPANSQMETIHNTKKRMPLIIPEDRSNEWLSNFDVKKEIEPFLVPFQHNLKAYTVSSFINKPKNNRNIDKAHQNYNYPELDNPQLDLF
ncbi:putative SOS response-associated peptidase YedK [Aureibacter tunicatorum]|uniref:Abasic site processing protein n=2 Tax=Aureibacter tunicatorum TaxID=866807 RepID=A0AAE3XTA2_9BACT|nr:putative SOS response-associated peptidase YedK [Aureibacter tunicatorum]